jgi:bacterioferritin
MIKNDLAAESGAVKAYNDGITLAGDLGDEGTADLLVTILKMEEDHIDWAEKQLTQIDQMGLQNYLGLQIGEAEEEE